MADYVKCPTCNGKGVVARKGPLAAGEKQCPNCKGTGKIKRTR